MSTVMSLGDIVLSLINFVRSIKKQGNLGSDQSENEHREGTLVYMMAWVQETRGSKYPFISLAFGPILDSTFKTRQHA
jgi:hypothetical protein